MSTIAVSDPAVSDNPQPATLTEVQRGHLRWIADNTIKRSRWLENGKSARRHPRHWSHIELAGPEGSRLIAKADWQALRPMIKPHDDLGWSFWMLSDLGRAELSRQS